MLFVTIVGSIRKLKWRAEYIERPCSAAALERVPGTANVILPPMFQALRPNLCRASSPAHHSRCRLQSKGQSLVYFPRHLACLNLAYVAVGFNILSRSLWRCSWTCRGPIAYIIITEALHSTGTLPRVPLLQNRVSFGGRAHGWSLFTTNARRNAARNKAAAYFVPGAVYPESGK
jgi:hypothetical protein